MTDYSSFTFDISEALTPLDGRNRYKLADLSKYYSDFVLTKYRVKLELELLTKLSQYKIIRRFSKSELTFMHQYIETFSFNNYKRVREIEKITNHEAKAAEELVKEVLQKTTLKDVAEMVHFGLTSDDINNLSYALIMKNCLDYVIIPELKKILESIKQKAVLYKNLSMLGRTHGQPAAPTTLGKELLVFHERLKQQVEKLKTAKIKGKLTGNVGNLNSHKFIFPKANWLKFSSEFVSSLGLKADLTTTQIEPYDSLIDIFEIFIHINNILIGLSVDFWIYLSQGYFQQKLIKKEVGSTALPHKINPIYFEGAEGGLGIANSLFEFYCRKLSYSRLQRDLSDSTVRRSFGIALGYSVLSYKSIDEALNRIEAHRDNIKQDLSRHPEVISEAIQNFLRVKNYHGAYDKTKEFFRGKKVNSESIKKFIKSLGLEEKDEQKLIELQPENYTGYAEELVEKFL